MTGVGPEGAVPVPLKVKDATVKKQLIEPPRQWMRHASTA